MGVYVLASTGTARARSHTPISHTHSRVHAGPFAHGRVSTTHSPHVHCSQGLAALTHAHTHAHTHTHHRRRRSVGSLRGDQRRLVGCGFTRLVGSQARRHKDGWRKSTQWGSGRPYWTRSAFRTARPISPRTAHHLSSSIPPAPSLDRRLSIGQAHRPRKSQASLVLAHPCSHQSALTHTALTPVGSRAHCAHARLSRTAFAPCQFWRTSAS